MRLLDFLDHLLDELVVDLLLDEEAAAGAAALALVEEEGEVRAFDGRVEIGVGEDDVGALAAELERDALEVRAGGGLHDQLADLGAAGEGDLVDVVVLGDGRAGGLAVAGDDVDARRREARFHRELADARGAEQRRLLGGLQHARCSRPPAPGPTSRPASAAGNSTG